MITHSGAQPVIRGLTRGRESMSWSPSAINSIKNEQEVYMMCFMMYIWCFLMCFMIYLWCYDVFYDVYMMLWCVLWCYDVFYDPFLWRVIHFYDLWCFMMCFMIYLWFMMWYDVFYVLWSIFMMWYDVFYDVMYRKSKATRFFRAISIRFHAKNLLGQFQPISSTTSRCDYRGSGMYFILIGWFWRETFWLVENLCVFRMIMNCGRDVLRIDLELVLLFASGTSFYTCFRC